MRGHKNYGLGSGVGVNSVEGKTKELRYCLCNSRQQLVKCANDNHHVRARLDAPCCAGFVLQRDAKIVGNLFASNRVDKLIQTTLEVHLKLYVLGNVPLETQALGVCYSH